MQISDKALPGELVVPEKLVVRGVGGRKVPLFRALRIHDPILETAEWGVSNGGAFCRLWDFRDVPDLYVEIIGSKILP